MLFLRIREHFVLLRHLKIKTFIKFGRLVNASHVSLEYDYEVTGVELDVLVHNAWEQEGVIGARMTGAGLWMCYCYSKQPCKSIY